MQHWNATLLALALAAPAFAADPPAPGRILFQNVCAQCHGPNGEGNVAIKSPSIAGLPGWYLMAQIENFRADRRGAHPQDPEGQLMRAISKILNTEQTKQVVEYVSILPRQGHEATLKVDLAAGRELFVERCMECHRYNGEGELVFGAAPLVGLQDWYLASQLRKFQNGMRGAQKDDVNGQKMVFSSGYIADDATLKSVAAFVLTLPESTQSAAGGFGK
ncbi:MAG TPA: c-type cytochrome [Verrucomicrobiaceae bacterium]